MEYFTFEVNCTFKGNNNNNDEDDDEDDDDDDDDVGMTEKPPHGCVIREVCFEGKSALLNSVFEKHLIKVSLCRYRIGRCFQGNAYCNGDFSMANDI